MIRSATTPTLSARVCAFVICSTFFLLSLGRVIHSLIRRAAVGAAVEVATLFPEEMRNSVPEMNLVLSTNFDVLRQQRCIRRCALFAVSVRAQTALCSIHTVHLKLVACLVEAVVSHLSLPFQAPLPAPPSYNTAGSSGGGAFTLSAASQIASLASTTFAGMSIRRESLGWSMPSPS